MSVIGILSPRCCSFFRGSWLILSGRNMPSSPSTETGNRLIESRIESHSAVAREYLQVIEFFLCELILKKVADITRGVPKNENDCGEFGRLLPMYPLQFGLSLVYRLTCSYELQIR